jgi:hypothetical protein
MFGSVVGDARQRKRASPLCEPGTISVMTATIHTIPYLDTESARPAKDRSTLYEEITNKIIADLEAGRLPWVQPWAHRASRALLGMPKNGATRSGI